MPKRDIIVIGGSAGAIEALVRLVRELPQNLEAAVFVVVHLPDGHETALPQILSFAGGRPGALARDGAPIESGRILVAHPGYHLLLETDRVRVINGPRENRFRPSIDVLFRSAAVALGPRVIGIILSGTLDDGKAGLEAIGRASGKTLVQSPEDALFPELPFNTLKAIPVDHSLTVSELAPLLVGLVQEECPSVTPMIEDLAKEVQMIKETGDHKRLVNGIGDLTAFKCSDCGGALWEMRKTSLLRFRCHLGHAFSAESLGEGSQEDTEKAMWQAVELMKEQVNLYEGMAERIKAGDPELAARFETKARRSRANAGILEKLVKEYPS